VSSSIDVAVLAGGVGAARFLQGLVQIVDPERITAIVNTGDDLDFYGLHVSPDLDIVMYTLAGINDEQKGWGLRGDTFEGLKFLAGYGEDTWFGLGDRDLATCLLRTHLLRDGLSLSAVTDHLRSALGVRTRLLPMSDQPIRTRILTPDGVLPFQEYFVKRAQRDEVVGVEFAGVEAARPAPGVLEALDEARAIIIAPSNPFVSIGTILAVPGVRAILQRRREDVVAISPIIGGEAVKGPAAQMLRTMGVEISAYGVASLYRDTVGAFVLDQVDAELADRVAALGMQPIVAQTLMSGLPEKLSLARTALDAVLGPTQR
jgi:LPPG:FO 2-phospho-L-lactate transferase